VSLSKGKTVKDVLKSVLLFPMNGFSGGSTLKCVGEKDGNDPRRTPALGALGNARNNQGGA